MTEQQDVLEPKRRRRHGNTILLGSIPVAVAITALLTAGTWASVPASSTLADSANTAPIPAPADTAPSQPSIVAPGSVADAAVTIPLVTVVLPPPPPPVVKAPVAKSSPYKSTAAAKQTTTAKKSTANKSAPKKSTPKKQSSKKSSQPSFQSFCRGASANSGASGGPKALLSAANNERARLGIKKLSWSSSLAGSATKWSKSMAAKDSKSGAPHDALAHNPNRPGAENVAMSYGSNGQSQGNAISRAHSGWMKSEGHCLNLMNPAYSTMGAGAAATSDGTTWYTTANFR